MTTYATATGFGGQRLAFAGLLIIATLAVCALFAPWLAPMDPIAINPLARLSPPSAEHWFGTDHFGRDTLSRVIYGSRMAAFIGIGVVAIALGGGITFGVLSAIFPRLGMLLMRIVDVMMAFPGAAPGSCPDRGIGTGRGKFHPGDRRRVHDHYCTHRLWCVS